MNIYKMHQYISNTWQDHKFWRQKFFSSWRNGSIKFITEFMSAHTPKIDLKSASISHGKRLSSKLYQIEISQNVTQ